MGKDCLLKNCVWGVISLGLIISDGPSNIANLGVWELWEVPKGEEGAGACCFPREWKGPHLALLLVGSQND